MAKFCNINLKDLGEKPRNVDTTSSFMSAFIDSVHQYGVMLPIIVTEDLTVLDGWNRVYAARICELETIPAIMLEANEQIDFPNNFNRIMRESI